MPVIAFITCIFSFRILQDKGLTKYSEVNEFTNALYDSGSRSPHLLGFMIDQMEESLLSNANEELFRKAVDVSYLLITLHFLCVVICIIS